MEAEARRRAFAGSDTLLIFLLKGARPDKYRERPPAVNIANSASANANANVNYLRVTPELLAEIQERRRTALEYVCAKEKPRPGGNGSNGSVPYCG